MSTCGRSAPQLRALLMGVLVALVACSPKVPGYRDLYSRSFAEILPARASIATEESRRSFATPPSRVVDVCISVAVQRGAVIGVVEDAEGGTRMIVSVGGALSDESFEGSLMSRAQGYQATVALEVWIALSIQASGSGSDLYASLIDPDSGRTFPFVGYGEPIEGEQAAFRQMARRLTAEFLHDVGEQIEGPPAWRGKLEATHRNVPRRSSAVAARKAVWEDLAAPIGNGISARIRREFYVLDASETVRVIEEIVARLSDAVPLSAPLVAVYIISSPQDNATVTPTGELFVTSGLLHTVENADQLAFVLAHELDHYAQHDTLYRARSQYRGIAAGFGLYAALGLGGLATFLVLDPDHGGPDLSGNSDDSPKRTAGIIALAGIAVGVVGLLYVWTHGKEIFTGNYSRDEELRADRNAVRYMWQSGYDVGAALAYLRKHYAAAP